MWFRQFTWNLDKNFGFFAANSFCIISSVKYGISWIWEIKNACIVSIAGSELFIKVILIDIQKARLIWYYKLLSNADVVQWLRGWDNSKSGISGVIKRIDCFNLSFFWVGALQFHDHSITDLLLITENCSSSHVSKRVLSKEFLQSTGVLKDHLHSLGIVLAVTIVDWDACKWDNNEHVHQGQKDIKVGVHTVTKHQERFIDQLGLTLWDFNLHFLQKCLSESMSEIWLWLSSTPFEWLEEWQNHIHFGWSSHWMKIFNIHNGLIDLLLVEHIVTFFGSFFDKGLHEFLLTSLLWHRNYMISFIIN